MPCSEPRSPGDACGASSRLPSGWLGIVLLLTLAAAQVSASAPALSPGHVERVPEPQLCFAPGTPAATVEAYYARRLFEQVRTSLQGPTPSRHNFNDADRWTTTATDGGGLGQGDVTTLTWSIVPDGTSIYGYNGEGTSNSNLKSFLNGIYGSQATWLALFQSVFDRWGELTGVTYVYEPNDDGSPWTQTTILSGALGVRGDVRISGHFIDGNSGVLAYNFFPNFGDMVIDTGDNTYNNTTGNSLRLRNILAHEHGHGLGMPHVCPVEGARLMEPFLATGFDGPQDDDILAGQRGYGDDLEDNDAPGEAEDLGSVTSSTVEDVAVDDDSDHDYYSFDVALGSEVSATVTPLGSSYLNGPQNANGSCSAGTLINTLDDLDLEIEVLDTDGSTVLASADSNGAGLNEALSNVALSSGAGTYYVVIQGGGANTAQRYELDLSVAGASPETLTITRGGNGEGSVTSSPAGIDCGSTCSAEFPAGEVVSLSADADPGSSFSQWSGHADCLDGSVTMNGARSCTATFALDEHTLTITKSGSGTGTVTSNPAGINCGSTCSADFVDQQTVVLSAQPASGSTFGGWTGPADCFDGSVELSSDLTCTATFTAIPRTLTIAKSGAGSGLVTSSPGGIHCGSTCSKAFDHGQTVILSAAPDSSSTFVGWSGPADCTDGTVQLSSNLTCTATFAPIQRTLTINKTGSGSGTVTSSPAGINCGATCSAGFDDDQAVTLSANAANGSTFTGWSGPADCADGSVTMSSNLTCTASFSAIPRTLTITKSGAGAGTVTSSPSGIDCGSTCDADFDHGQLVTLMAAPATGSTFSGWSGPADCADGSVTMSSNLTCTATFTLEKRTLSVSRTGSGSGTVSSSPAGISCGGTCSADFDYGEVVTLTPTPTGGSTFIGWSGDSDCADSQVTMTASRSCVATFSTEPNAFVLSVEISGDGAVRNLTFALDCPGVCAVDVSPGTPVDLFAFPGLGSVSTGFSGDADCVDASVTMDGPRHCIGTFELSEDFLFGDGFESGDTTTWTP